MVPEPEHVGGDLEALVEAGTNAWRRGVGNMPNFVEFSREDSRTSDEPMFTLQRRGLISFNQATFKALGEPAAVALLYDAAEGIVALRKVGRTYANGYNVRKQPNSHSYLVGSQGFSSFHKIPTEEPRRFAGHDYGDQTWGFVLSEGVVVKFTPRRKRQASGDDATEHPPA
jgi:hypothetical protein